MTLGTLQRNFRSWLTSGSDETARLFGSDARAGLDVYQNNYRAQLVGCLEEAFPQVRAWIGDEAFLYAAVRHIENHPPHAWTLDAYADEFSSTLGELFPRNGDILELAWIESALAAAFIARDAKPVTSADFATVDWDSARLRLSPSLRIMRATTNAADIWMAMREGRDRPEGEMLAEPCGVTVWRRGFVSCLRTVDALERDALGHVQMNSSFSALCEMLVDHLGESDGVAKAGALLAGWIDNELIIGIDSIRS